jgi:hypothetical protein
VSKEISSEYTPDLAFIKRAMYNVEKVCKSVTILLATYLSISYLLKKEEN